MKYIHLLDKLDNQARLHRAYLKKGPDYQTIESRAATVIRELLKERPNPNFKQQANEMIRNLQKANYALRNERDSLNLRNNVLLVIVATLFVSFILVTL